MKIEKFYKDQGYPELDKSDKKAPKFTYYNMLEFAEDYHAKNVVKFKMPWIKYVNRIIGFPFMVCIIIITMVTNGIYQIINYISFGGESIIYNKDITKKRIIDLYRKLNEKII